MPIVYRSAVTGEFVCKAYALSHPKSTIRQTLRKRKVCRPARKAKR